MATQASPDEIRADRAPTLVPLDEIVENPWQPRTQLDEQALADLMASIEEDGLLQHPVGRRNDDRMLGVVELALGHNRLEAYRRLSKSRKKGYKQTYSAMPVRIQELTDLQMARLAVIENVRRDDLKVTEKARAMLRFRDEFGQSTEEIGEIFGVEPATVRGIIRLLHLPAGLHPFLDDGRLPQVAARQLLALQKVAPNAVAGVAEQLDPDDDVIQHPNQIPRLAYDAIGDEAAPIFRDWGPGDVPFTEKWKPKKATIKRAPAVTAAAAAKAFPDLAAEDLEHALARVNGKQPQGGEVPQEAIDKIVHLESPPACSACPFYAKVDGRGYCGVPACQKRKVQMWRDEELHRVARKLGVKVFDKAADGKFHKSAPSYWGDETDDWWDNAVDEKADHLRVLLVREAYSPHEYTDSRHVELISLHEKFVQRLEEKAEAEANAESWEERHAREEAERLVRSGNRARNMRILQDLVVPHLGDALLALESPSLLEHLYLAVDDSWPKRDLAQLPKQKAKRAEALRALIMASVARQALDREDRDAQDVKATAKWFKMTLASALGVKLPADFVDQALALAETMQPCAEGAWCGWYPADELTETEVDGQPVLLCHRHHQEALGRMACERCEKYFDQDALMYVYDDLFEEPEEVLEALSEMTPTDYEYVCKDCKGDIDTMVAQIKQQQATEA